MSPWYSWNIAESGVKHHISINHLTIVMSVFFTFFLLLPLYLHTFPIVALKIGKYTLNFVLIVYLFPKLIRLINWNDPVHVFGNYNKSLFPFFQFSRYKSELQQRKEENTSVGTVLDTTDTARSVSFLDPHSCLFHSLTHTS